VHLADARGRRRPLVEVGEPAPPVPPELLAEHLPEIGYVAPEASFLAWLDCRPLGLGDDPAAAFLARGRVALSPGLDYGRSGEGFVRLNFGTSPEHVAEAVRRMAAAV
jgi:cystathionine beta-lyase